MPENIKNKRVWFLVGGVALLLFVLLAIWLFGASSPLRKGVTGSGGVVATGDTGNRNAGESFGVGADTTGIPQNNASGVAHKEPLFKQLTTVPVAGTTMVTRDSRSLIRYVESETGHIFDVDPRSGQTTEITNTTFEHGVSEAVFLGAGERVIVRYLERNALGTGDIIKTYLGKIDGTSTGVGAVHGMFLPDGITALATAQDGKSFLFLMEDTAGVIGTLYGVASGTTTEVFRNPFREWTPEMTARGDIILTTKASGAVPGFSYRYDVKKKALTRVLRERTGLTVKTAPSGTTVLYTENIFGVAYTSLHSMTNIPVDEWTRAGDQTLDIVTIPEKCTWNSGESLLYCGTFTPPKGVVIPDSWYQGVTALSDRFWIVDPKTLDITLLSDPEVDAKRSFDTTLPLLTPDESYLSFVNKGDGFLWSLRIEIPPEGGGATGAEKRDIEGSTK